MHAKPLLEQLGDYSREHVLCKCVCVCAESEGVLLSAVRRALQIDGTLKWRTRHAPVLIFHRGGTTHGETGCCDQQGAPDTRTHTWEFTLSYISVQHMPDPSMKNTRTCCCSWININTCESENPHPAWGGVIQDGSQLYTHHALFYHRSVNMCVCMCVFKLHACLPDSLHFSLKQYSSVCISSTQIVCVLVCVYVH